MIQFPSPNHAMVCRRRQVGILMGLAVYNGVLLDVAFPPALYKKLLARPLALPDLADLRSRSHARAPSVISRDLFFVSQGCRSGLCVVWRPSWRPAFAAPRLPCRVRGAARDGPAPTRDPQT